MARGCEAPDHFESEWGGQRHANLYTACRTGNLCVPWKSKLQ
jgi:hypothetical protein